jgi:uracil phosphoribosyltransferase
MLEVLNHPLITHKLTQMRKASTGQRISERIWTKLLTYGL